MRSAEISAKPQPFAPILSRALSRLSVACRPWLWCSPALFLYVGVFCIPLAMMFVLSFRAFDQATGQIETAFTFTRYLEAVSDPYYQEVFGRTLGISLFVTILSVCIGTPEAYILSRMKSQWRSIFLLVVLGPLLVSVVVRTLGWAIILGNNGILNQFLISLGAIKRPLSIMLSNTAIIIGLFHISVPLMVISVWTSLQKHDTATERAALSLGASQFAVFTRIVLPQVAPGILSGALVVFSLAASAFATPALLGGRGVKVVSTAVSDEFLGTLDWPLGAALAVLLLLANILISTGYNRFVRNRFKETFQ